MQQRAHSNIAVMKKLFGVKVTFPLSFSLLHKHNSIMIINSFHQTDMTRFNLSNFLLLVVKVIIM